ncbi:hypothetical protein FIBSPDRAFT_889994 [Athelia psychrophila]|uniref:Uncharacterized protein n=1 Tax=Athelia psychrophila TaxID=1759441 RepID=A0A166LEM7_9AGAM|nr:hypothetical protein FIBSPDRAFT_889994 [Fibularhizoctonia sp. CBS 109695]
MIRLSRLLREEQQYRVQDQQMFNAQRYAAQQKHGKEMEQVKEAMAVVKDRDEKTQLELKNAEKKLKAETERLQTEFQKRFNADQDAAQKEVVELKQMHEAERKKETQMKELQEQLRAQEQQRFNKQLADPSMLE